MKNKYKKFGHKCVWRYNAKENQYHTLCEHKFGPSWGRDKTLLLHDCPYCEREVSFSEVPIVEDKGKKVKKCKWIYNKEKNLYYTGCGEDYLDMGHYAGTLTLIRCPYCKKEIYQKEANIMKKEKILPLYRYFISGLYQIDKLNKELFSAEVVTSFKIVNAYLLRDIEFVLDEFNEKNSTYGYVVSYWKLYQQIKKKKELKLHWGVKDDSNTSDYIKIVQLGRIRNEDIVLGREKTDTKVESVEKIEREHLSKIQKAFDRGVLSGRTTGESMGKFIERQETPDKVKAAYNNGASREREHILASINEMSKTDQSETLENVYSAIAARKDGDPQVEEKTEARHIEGESAEKRLERQQILDIADKVMKPSQTMEAHTRGVKSERSFILGKIEHMMAGPGCNECGSIRDEKIYDMIKDRGD